MKTAFWPVAILAWFTSLSAGEIPWEGKIETVTVYTNGFAQVTRGAEAAVPAGVTTFKSNPLPPSADLASIYVAVQGEGVAVQSVETRRELVSDKELEAKLAAFREEYRKQDDARFMAQQEEAAIDEQIASRRETLALLEKMREKTGQVANKEMSAQKVDAEAWQKAIEMAQAQADKARAEIRQLTAKRREAERRLWEEEKKLGDVLRKAPKGCGIPMTTDSQSLDSDQTVELPRQENLRPPDLRRLLQDLASAQTYQTRVFITVAAKAATNAKLFLSYNVRGADWEPNYRVSADLKAKNAILDIFGVVRQSSGEDWQNAQINLSTARPDIGTDVPVLLPWYIWTAQLPARPARRNLSRYDDLKTEEAPSGEAPAEEEAPITSVATVFTAKSRTTIPSDNEAHRIPISSLSSAIEIEHVAIPKILPQAFVRAKLANRAPFALIPGAMEVLIAGSYVGRGMMKAAAPGEAIKLSLGVDEQVKIRLNLVEDKGERKVRGGRAQATNVFAITAANYKDEEIKLTIIDQLPISRDSRIAVTYGPEAKRALRGADFPGQLKWEITLAPQKTQTIEFDFTIEYPEEMRQELEEYNRRNAVEYQYEQLAPQDGKKFRTETRQGQAAAAAKF